MKIAIIHDELLRKGGAERVVISIHKLYPNAVIYTSSYNPDTTFDYFKSCKIKTSFLNRFVRNEKMLMAVFFPFGILAFRLLNLRHYDLIIISSAHGAQYIRRPTSSICINYVHYPFRLIWEPESYSLFQGFLGKFISPLFTVLRSLDRVLTVRADFIFFNSERTKSAYSRIFKGIASSVLCPPVPLSDFIVTENTKEYFLVVSRLETYKRVDLVIRAFNTLKAEKLLIVGSGTKEKELLSLIEGTNISFKKNIDNSELKMLYANCKALIFPQVEDFGITPIEANASGRPVIAFKEGGVLETMIEDKTAVFFSEQTELALIDAINRFNMTSFNREDILKNAIRFDESNFHDQMKFEIDSLIKQIN